MRFYHIIFSNSMLLLLSVVSPLHIHGSPGKSCAECSENKVVAFLQLIFKVPDAKRQRSSTGIAVTFDINHLAAGDYVVLVSDGLLVDGPGWVMQQLELSAAKAEQPDVLAKKLVEAARARAVQRGRPDDITAAVLRLENS